MIFYYNASVSGFSSSFLFLSGVPLFCKSIKFNQSKLYESKIGMKNIMNFVADKKKSRGEVALLLLLLYFVHNNETALNVPQGLLVCP